MLTVRIWSLLWWPCRCSVVAAVTAAAALQLAPGPSRLPAAGPGTLPQAATAAVAAEVSCKDLQWMAFGQRCNQGNPHTGNSHAAIRGSTSRSRGTATCLTATASLPASDAPPPGCRDCQAAVTARLPGCLGL